MEFYKCKIKLDDDPQILSAIFDFRNKKYDFYSAKLNQTEVEQFRIILFNSRIDRMKPDTKRGKYMNDSGLVVTIQNDIYKKSVFRSYPYPKNIKKLKQDIVGLMNTFISDENTTTPATGIKDFPF